MTAATGPAVPFRVALTFDVEHHDRPATADATETLLGLLTGLELRATCFIQGRWAEAYPEVARSIPAAGHLVGNHSYYHARMPLLTDAGLAEDLTEAGRVITETTGADPRPWFRCPFGAGADDPRVQAAVRAAGYRHVGWHVGVEDWDPAKSAATIEREVVDGTLAHGDGAVVLLHAWPTATRDAIGAIAGRLRDAGAAFVTIDALGEVPGTVT
jgi:peptidoglycan-N-acetylglucosamine deacetylase